MKIALFTDGIYPFVLGGMQKHSFYLAKYLARKGIYVHIFHCVASDKSLVKELKGFSHTELKFITHSCIHKPIPKSYPGYYIRESYLLSKKFFSEINNLSGFDFIYAQGFTGWFYGKQGLINASFPPLITNFHGLEMFQKAANLPEKIKQYLFKIPVKRVSQLSDLNCSLGGQLTNILKQLVPKEKIIETPIGISEDWLIDESDVKINSKRKFVFIGRYERRKGIEELSSVLEKLINLYDFEFHFIGPISTNKQINSDKIIYHGLIKEPCKIKSILQEADTLVCPSYSEGMPTVVLEAMASASAIIASNVGAVCEEVDHSNGILIKAGDTQQLEQALIEMINIELFNLMKMKQNALTKIKEKFLWSQTVDITLSQIKNKLE